MPSSHQYQLSELVTTIKLCNPRSVLDIGIGFGKMGMLCREYLDIALDQNYNSHDWKRKIDGIEIFDDYICDHHKIFYNNIYTGNATEIVKACHKEYDLILLIDVIEHFSKKIGIDLLTMLKKISRNVLISTPVELREQETVFNNYHEQHISHWKPEELVLFPTSLQIHNSLSTIIFTGSASEIISKGLSKIFDVDLLVVKTEESNEV